MKRAADRRGMSLIELLVAMFVLGLLTTGALTLFLPTLSRFASADTTYDAQRQALSGVRALSFDLRESSMGVLVTASGTAGAPDSIAIPTSRNQAGRFCRVDAPNTVDFGKPAWQGWIVYWCAPDPDIPNTYRLLRIRRDGPVPASSSFDPLAGLGTRGRLIASGVSGLAVRPIVSPGGRGRVTVSLKLVRYLHDRATTFEGEEIVDMAY